MRKMKMKMFVFCGVLLLFSHKKLMSQDGTNASGGQANGTDGTVSYSVGQVFSASTNGGTYNLAEGVQQPYEIFEVTSVESAVAIKLNISAYPNPVMHHLTLEIDAENLYGLSFQMYDISGKKIKHKKINSNSTNIDTEGLKPGTYLINVFENKSIIKEFKIIKK